MGKIDVAKREARLRTLGLSGKLPEALTERVLEAVRTHPLDERYTLSDGEVRGLVLQVAANGTASFVLHYRTRDGIQHTTGIPSGSLKDVRAYALAELAKVRAGGDPVGEKREARGAAVRAKSGTVRAYLEGPYWLEKLKHRKGRNGAIAKTHMLAAWKDVLDVQLGALTRDAIEKVLGDRKSATKKDGTRKTKDGTLLRHWNPLRAMLDHAVRRGYLAAMPTTGRPEPLRGLHDEPRVRWLGENDSDEEIAKGEGERARFFKALDKFESDEPGGGDFLRCTARIAINTGMRRGELLRLRDDMIKRNPDRLELTAAITKSNKARKVFLNPDALAALKRWLEVRKTLKVQSIRGELFPGEGEPEKVAERWEDRITQREFPRLCEQAGVTGLVFHHLRHYPDRRIIPHRHTACASPPSVRGFWRMLDAG